MHTDARGVGEGPGEGMVEGNLNTLACSHLGSISAAFSCPALALLLERSAGLVFQAAAGEEAYQPFFVLQPVRWKDGSFDSCGIGCI